MNSTRPNFRSRRATDTGGVALAVALLPTLVLALGSGAARAAADLPPHGPLRILVVSDRVNPHNLPPEELTEPGEVSAALLTPGSGVNLDTSSDAVVEIGTDDIEQATALLQLPPFHPSHYDVLIYFSHRAPNGADAQARQEAFVLAVESFLEFGGGVVSFHHGSYLLTGKESVLELIGGTASGSVVYDQVTGQNVINVAPGHFVTENGVAYEGSTSYADPTRGVPSDDYALFNNTPDERYPAFEINAGAGDVRMLFASDYDQSGSQHVLGFTHWRPGWCGYVVAYQPGEYQPNALDLDGNGFQILANAIVYSASALAPAADGIELTVAPGATGDSVSLEWSMGSGGPYTVYGTDRPRGAGVTRPCNNLAETASLGFDDTPPPLGVYFYRVSGP